MGGVFINYRTADAGLGAAMLDQRLVDRFGDAAVFRDNRSIPMGTPFERTLWQRLRTADIVLALIGPHWLTGIDDSGDYVRRELVEALQLGIDVCPVLLAPGSMPGADDLPDDLKQLRKQQYHVIRARESKPDMDALIDKLAARPALAGLGPQASGQHASAGGIVIQGNVHAKGNVVFGDSTEHHYGSPS